MWKVIQHHKGCKFLPLINILGLFQICWKGVLCHCHVLSVKRKFYSAFALNSCLCKYSTSSAFGNVPSGRILRKSKENFGLALGCIIKFLHVFKNKHTHFHSSSLLSDEWEDQCGLGSWSEILSFMVILVTTEQPF